jgi:hypothetical protein
MGDLQHFARPIKDSSCCDNCHSNIVIPARLSALLAMDTSRAGGYNTKADKDARDAAKVSANKADKDARDAAKVSANKTNAAKKARKAAKALAERIERERVAEAFKSSVVPTTTDTTSTTTTTNINIKAEVKALAAEKESKRQAKLTKKSAKLVRTIA